MKILGIILAVVIVAILASFLIAWPFMLIWNYAVVSALTIAKPINYWVAFWLMLFISLFATGSKSHKE